MAKLAQRLQPEDSRHADAPAHLALADALARGGRVQEAAQIYQAALEIEPASRDARLGLARAQLMLGHAIEAFQAADPLLASDLADVEAWIVVAEALESLGEPQLAAPAFARALALQPQQPELQLRLGGIYEQLDRPFDAAVRFQAALSAARAETRREAHLALSGLHGRANQFAESRTHAEAALTLDPNSQGAHQNLAVIAASEGREAEAQAHREAAYRGRSRVVTRARAPRRRVLVLASAARANSPDRYLIPSDRYDRIVWFVGYGGGVDPADYDVVFNAVAEPTAHAEAEHAAAFALNARRPLLNAPQALARTARDQAHCLFEGVDDLVVPATRRIASGEVIAGEDRYLLRPLGSHGGERLELLQAAEISARVGDGGAYLTPFCDYRSADGLFRKYRVVFVDRVAYPYHLAIHDHWLAHYQTSRTAELSARRDEERAFLEDPAAAVGRRAWAAIEAVGRRLDLDFAGVDFALLPDGRALLFEANATMFVHPEAPDGPLAHKNPFVQRILEAFWRQLEQA